jgi:hypothetical protein
MSPDTDDLCLPCFFYLVLRADLVQFFKRMRHNQVMRYDFPVRSHPSRSADVAIHTGSQSQAFNLPGWRWATIKQVALDRLSRSLHSDVCDSDGCNDVVVHSKISGRGGRRERAALNNSSIKILYRTQIRDARALNR